MPGPTASERRGSCCSVLPGPSVVRLKCIPSSHGYALCVCVANTDNAGRQSTQIQTGLPQTEGALCVRVCVYIHKRRILPAAGLGHLVCPVAAPGSQSPQLLAPGHTSLLVPQPTPSVLSSAETRKHSQAQSWPLETRSKPFVSRPHLLLGLCQRSHTHKPSTIPKCPSPSSCCVFYTLREQLSLTQKVMRRAVPRNSC